MSEVGVRGARGEGRVSGLGSARPAICPFLQLSAISLLHVLQAVPRKHNRHEVPGNPRCWPRHKDGCCPRDPGQPSDSAICLTNLTDRLLSANWVYYLCNTTWVGQVAHGKNR